MSALHRKVVRFINEHGLIPSDGEVLVAVSGGVDSVVLLRVLDALGYSVAIAHCNFQLRVASAEDAAFVEGLARALNCPYYHRRFDTKDYALTHKCSVQVAAREQRYAFFNEVMTRYGYDVCAVAHQRDDLVETRLMSLLRGGHARIMEGIPVTRDRFVRPFLGVHKTEILAYAEARGIAYREDESNAQDDYLRNFVRHHLVPVLGEINPSYSDRLDQVAKRLGTQWRLVSARFAQLAQQFVRTEGGIVDVDLEGLGHALEADGLAEFLVWLLAPNGFSGAEISAVQQLVDAGTGRRVLARAGEVLKNRGQLKIRYRTLERYEVDTALEIGSEAVNSSTFALGPSLIECDVLSDPGEVSFPPAQGVHYLDLDAVQFPLRVRRWQTGDRMRPMGLSGTKLLSDIFIDAQWDRFQKENAVIFEDQVRIVCLSGFRIAEEVKLTDATKNVLKITIRPHTATFPA